MWRIKIWFEDWTYILLYFMKTWNNFWNERFQDTSCRSPRPGGWLSVLADRLFASFPQLVLQRVHAGHQLPQALVWVRVTGWSQRTSVRRLPALVVLRPALGGWSRLEGPVDLARCGGSVVAGGGEGAKPALEPADHCLRAGQLGAKVLHEALERRVVTLGGGFSEGGAAAAGRPPLGTTVQRRTHLQVIELCQEHIHQIHQAVIKLTPGHLKDWGAAPLMKTYVWAFKLL